MEKARQLRDKAEHCMRLSLYVSNPADVASFESLAAEANEAAAEIEAEAARLAARLPAAD
jgi:hypothetical protein